MAKEWLQITIMAYYHFTSHLTFGQSVRIDQNESHKVVALCKEVFDIFNLPENVRNFCFCWKAIL